MTRDTPIKLNSRWRRADMIQRGGEYVELHREIRVIAEPTLSSPVGFKVVKNDAHPHRRGKTGSMKVSKLLAMYEPVVAA